MEESYGSRSEDAFKNVNDLKNLYHAYRSLSEIEEYLLTGKITLPRPDANFLKEIRAGKYNSDYRTELEQKIHYLKTDVKLRSMLPELPDYENINKLCNSIINKHIIGVNCWTRFLINFKRS